MQPNHKPSKKKKSSNTIPEKLVIAVFKRDSNICQYCGLLTAGLDEYSTLASAHCHHIVKRRKADGHKEKLLNTCCFGCHNLHGEISKVDKVWLDGDNVYWGGRTK